MAEPAFIVVRVKETLQIVLQRSRYTVEEGYVTGEPSLFTIKAKTDSRVVTISKEDFYSIMRSAPFIVLNAAHATVKRMTPFVRQIDFALDWQMTEAGKALFRQGDNSESIFIVLTGRLRSVITLVGGKKELVDEYGRGELVGIVEVLTQTERATTVMAVRDTEVAMMPSELLNLIKRKYPQIVTRLIHLLGQRILGNLQSRNSLGAHVSMPYRTDNPSLDSRAVGNLATVAVLPASDDIPLTNFTLELQHNLIGIGPTTRLTSEIIKTRLGSTALDSVNEFRLFSWLGQQEDIHRMVLYQCDNTMSKWTRSCIRQADCILIVALADHEHAVGELEKELEGIAVRAQKELVLLHREDAETPRRTADWLNARSWCTTHHHIRCPPRVFSKRPEKKRLEVYEKLFLTRPNHLKDFSRLARYLTGTSIGLVLGGGGARGLSHVGVIKAINEAGIPIDMVGGTSMGSFIGALWCEEQNYTRFTQRAREWSMSIMIIVIVAVVTILVVLFFGIWKFRAKVLPSQSEAPKKYRFRKRDKVLFYGRKMLRKVRSFTKNTIASTRHGRKKMSHKDMMHRLRRFLERRKDSSLPQLRVKEPPKAFLEADATDMQDTDSRLPSEVLYMLRSIRVFGHLEKPFFLELCRHMESLNVKAGNYLFKIGDSDDSIYVVQSGEVEVFVTDKDGSQHLVKVVKTGDSIHSLLSMLDFLTGHPAPYKTVSAKASCDSLILKLPATAFTSMFKRFPESIVRVVQIMMIRLQRVTFMALHNYLGLSSELINPESSTDLRTLSIQAITPHSPHKIHKYSHASTMAAGNTAAELADPSHKLEDQDGRRPSYMRSTSEQTGRPKLSSTSSDKDRHPSDFDTACMRARVHQDDTFTSSVTGSPPSRQMYRESDVDGPTTPSSRHRPKRASGGQAESLGVVSDSNYSDEYILDLAQKDLLSLLGLKDPALLEKHLQLQHLRAGTVLCRQGDQDASLVFVVTGTLHMLQQIVGEEAREAILFTAIPGEMVGTLAVLTGEPSLFTIKAKTDSRVVTISKEDFYSIMRSAPFIVLNAAHATVKRMTPFVRQIDFALDWQMTEAGKALFRQGDNSESIFIVLTGRLRSVITLVGGKKELVDEYGRGELVGIVEVLTQTERATTVMAVRDTEVAMMPSELLNLIKRKYPQIVTRLIHLLGQRILGNLQSRNSLGAHVSMPYRTDNPSLDSRAVGNLATVAVLPASDDIPLTNFTLELQHNLIGIGPTTRLTSEIIKTRLGSTALDSVNEFRLFSWLGQQEDIHRMVLYQCDNTMSKWTRSCIRQADCILIVAQADHEHAVGELEKELEGIAVRAQKELVLLHREDAETPRRTADWLNARSWCTTHHHIRCPPRVFSKRPEKKRLEVYEKLFLTRPNHLKDFSRLARYLTGTSIGLVLGGGGARGLSHVGVIKAINEAGIPIDMVGGTSMGSFIGALWCEEQNYTRFTQRAREWSMDMTSLWKKIVDLTYPVTSMFTGRAFNHCIESVFKDRQVEDLWLPFFCVTTDISHSTMRIHTVGSLWRYVRGSMSLSGYLPPMCDPLDGHHLLDGGYVNNLPADVSHVLGAQTVLAVDVGSEEVTDFLNYGDQVSGWWLLWKRWNPWTENIKVLDMTEIQSRLAYVSCVRQLDVVKNSDYCEYLRPPIDKYGTLQFGSYDEISDVGYIYGKTLFDGWTKGGYLAKLFTEKSKENVAGLKKRQEQSHVPVMAYFTDLAEKVSKITKPISKTPIFYLDDDDYETEYTDEEIILEDDEFDEEEEEMEREDTVVETNPVYSSSNSDNSEATTARQRNLSKLKS